MAFTSKPNNDQAPARGLFFSASCGIMRFTSGKWPGRSNLLSILGWGLAFAGLFFLAIVYRCGIMDGTPRERIVMHRYYLTQRPPGIGCQPEGFIEVEWFVGRIFVPSIGREAWGYVEYDRKLTEKEITDYELTEAKCAD